MCHLSPWDTAVVWRERSQPVCVGIPKWARTCWSRGASWALLSAWPRWKSQDGQGLPGSFLGRLSCAMAADMHWGMNPVLDASLLKGAERVEGAEKQTHVVLPAMSSCLLFPISTTLGKQQRSREAEQGPGQWWLCDAAAMCFSPSVWHLALVRLWQGGFLRRNKLSPEPRKEHSCLLPR